METDPSAQAVLALVAEGMRHEGNDDIAGAIALYEQALATAEGDHAQCVAAHLPHLADVPPGDYRDKVRKDILDALERCTPV